MGAAETIERIVAQCDFETQIVPYSDDFRDQVIAGAHEMQDNSTFRDFKMDADKLIQQIKAAAAHPNALRFRLAVKDGEAYGAFFGQVTRMFFSDELMAKDVGWWVRQDRRGTWAAICLLRDFEDWAKSLGCKKVMLGQSSAVNIDATTRLYENCGYSVCGVNTVKGI